jgi:phospholipid/cholesterol/gamma-HCH transport system substrate-binding protein/paraquat-inducible protein B
MDNNTGYFRLGLFVLVGLALVVGGIVFFSSSAYSEDDFIIETVTLESAQGLDPGAPVKFRGVRIGHVRKIELAYTRYKDKIAGAEQNFGNAVILELGLREDGLPTTANPRERANNLKTAVERGLRARIASSSLTGPPYVEIVFLNPKTNPPLVLPWKPEKPYLPAGNSTFAQLVDAAQDIIESVRGADVGKVISHADALLIKADKMIDDIQMPEIRAQAIGLISELRDSNKKLQEILADPNIKAMLADLAGTAKSLHAAADSPDLKKFLTDLPEISARLKKTMEQINALLADENIRKSLANFNAAAGSASDAMADIRRLAKSANALLLSQQQDITAIIRNFRSLAENAAAITEDAKANPSRVLFGEPPARRKGVNP